MALVKDERCHLLQRLKDCGNGCGGRPRGVQLKIQEEELYLEEFHLFVRLNELFLQTRDLLYRLHLALLKPGVQLGDTDTHLYSCIILQVHCTSACVCVCGH